MRSSTARRLGVTALAATLIFGGLSGPTFADDPTGSIGGHFLGADGKAISGAQVNVFTTGDESYVGTVYTDDTGAYSLPAVANGDYWVEFLWGTSFIEWSHDQFDISTADTITVAGGAATTLDETALPIGTFAGTLTNPDGTAAAGVSVGVEDEAHGIGYGANTDDAGHWSVPVFAGTDLQITYGLPTAQNSLLEYAPHTGQLAQAGVYKVKGGKTTTVNDQILPTGTISGVYTDAQGNPEANAYVGAQFANGDFADYTNTDDTGAYSMPVFAGIYQVQFSGTDYKTQYAHGHLTSDGADTFAVTAGADTVVDESELPTGTVTVTATDALTGTAIKSFCADADSVNVCTKTGTVTLAGVRQGAETVSVSSTALKYLPANSIPVTVTAGQNSSLAVALQAGSIVTTTIDDGTGAPIEDACVKVYVPNSLAEQDFPGWCSDANGVVKIGPLLAGPHILFVTAPQGSSYGDQWVGHAGGTGQAQLAQVISTVADKNKALAPITLDRGGEITGHVASGIDGSPITNGVVGLNSITPNGGRGNVVRTDGGGNYVISNLGPYQWPVFAEASGFAPAWSGGVANRYQATTVPVTAGGVVDEDLTLATGTTLTGRALTEGGTAIADGGDVVAYDTVTGDVTGFVQAGPNGAFTIPILAGQKVTVQYRFADQTTGTTYEGNYGGTVPKVVTIPATGRRIHIVLVPSP